MEELLRLENICFRYEEGVMALNNISLTFSKGERVAVLGNNGAGKSTLFRCCNGVLHPESGRIFLDGREIKRTKQDIFELRQAVGLVFQEPDNQIIAGTVEDEVSFGPMNLKLNINEVKQRVNDSINRMNLIGYETRAPQYLSGGEKKRVSIADILAMRPRLILLDEPTASLDPENVALLEKTFDELSAAGIALVVSTHDVDFAYRFAQRAIVFSGGNLIADDSIDKVFASDSVISAARLRKPLLFEVAQAIRERFPNMLCENMPRSADEFKRFVNSI